MNDTLTKIVQMAAFFIQQAGGSLEIAKLPALIYLAERESFKTYGGPIAGDLLLALDCGPVLESTRLMALAGSGCLITLKHPYCTEELDHLSEANLETLQRVHAQFNDMSMQRLRHHTQVQCSEWTIARNFPYQIADIEVLRAVGFEEKAALHISNELAVHRQISAILAS